MLQKVLCFIRAGRLVSAGEKLLVAVSGGPDSVCLLYILAELREALGIELHIAHLDHRLRGKESAADAAYVAGLARRLRLPATIKSGDVKAYRDEHGLSLEEAARQVRYDFLAGVAKTVGAARAAVGHTADDHIETVLMHLLRGSGSRGLRGLLPLSRWPTASGSLIIIRPLLELSREETIAFCRRRHLRPRLDTSNLSVEFLRNRMRRRLLPEMKKYNPQVTEALLRTARIVNDDLAFIEEEVERPWGEIVREYGGAVVIDKPGLLALPPALKRHLLRRAIAAVLGDLKDIGAGNIEDMLAALDKPAGKVISLPFGLNFTIEYARFVLARDTAILCPFPALENEIALNVPGETAIPGWSIAAAVVPASGIKVGGGNAGFGAYFDFARTGSKLTVRHRRPGDRFQPLGMERPKKLNRFMMDARIPRSWRERIPIVASPERIIWVVGYRIGEHVKVTGATLTALRLEFKRR